MARPPRSRNTPSGDTVARAKDADASTAARDGRVLRAQERRAATRQQIFAAAQAQFAERGYHATSIEDILQRADVARGTFYLHFPSKRAIFDELASELFAMVRQRVRRIEITPEAALPLEQMRDNVVRVVELLLDKRELACILLREAGADPDFDRKREEFYGKILELIEGGIRLGQRMGLVRPCDVHIAACSVLGSVKELMFRYTVAGEPAPPSDALSSEVLSFVVSALFFAPQVNSVESS